jgi:hypothetical protein
MRTVHTNPEQSNMKTKLKAVLASIALLVATGAQATIVDGTTPNYGSDIIVSIYNKNTAQSALIDTNLNAVDLAASPSLFTLTDTAVTAFLGTGTAADFVFSVVGVQGNNATTTGLDFGTLVTRSGAGVGPNASALGSAISNIQGDLNGANADPAFSGVDILTGQTAGGAFHDNVTANAAFNHTWSIEGSLDSFVEFAWTHFTGPGVVGTEVLGYWDINSTTGQIRFDTAPAAVPLPAAVWLFASGLLGLVGVSRRRSA